MHVEHFEVIIDKGLIVSFCDEGGSDASMLGEGTTEGCKTEHK